MFKRFPQCEVSLFYFVNSKYFVGWYFKTMCISHFSLNFQFIHLLILAWAKGLSFHLLSLFILMFKLFHIWLLRPSSGWPLCSFDMSLLVFGCFQTNRIFQHHLYFLFQSLGVNNLFLRKLQLLLLENNIWKPRSLL